MKRLVRKPIPSPNPGNTLTGHGLRPSMGRAEKRAKDREDAKRGKRAQRSAREPGPDTFRRMAAERPETRNETARRVYRTGGKSQRRERKGRRASDRPHKWREGHQ